ncbi:hypothetical protein D1007_01938 [Hordeum vulgare]|nr:hypothetical protein D1007_01938 [Hordeum vulgare]
MLRVCTRDNIKCLINKFLGSIQEARVEPDPVVPLAHVWIIVYGLPRGAKVERILKAVSEPTCKLLRVDLQSLEGHVLTLIKVLCTTPADMDELSLIFYSCKKGERLTYEVDLEDLESREVNASEERGFLVLPMPDEARTWRREHSLAVGNSGQGLRAPTGGTASSGRRDCGNEQLRPACSGSM